MFLIAVPISNGLLSAKRRHNKMPERDGSPEIVRSAPRHTGAPGQHGSAEVDRQAKSVAE